MARRNLILASCSALAGLAAAQKPGDTTDEHPTLITQRCSVEGGCSDWMNFVVLDSSSHWVHQVADDSFGCGDWGSTPNATVCSTKEACQENCVMEGVTDYSSHGITTDGHSLRLQQIVDGGVVSPRLYLLDATKENYEITKFTGSEFAFDVDATKLPCGMNSALYLSEMATDGGRSDLNTGGATWGTGYCDAQCYVTPFINGEGNVDGYGACCNEVDIWEANSRSNHIAPHPCSIEGPYNCEGAECEAEGVCDKNGCSWNPYRIGQPDYYGTSADFDVDTTRPFTVVTQFPADGEGTLTAINRLYVQDGAVIRAEVVNKEGLPAQDYMDDAFCEAAGSTAFMGLGAMAGMGAAMARGMVLTFSIWWDDGGNMSWLDGEADGAGPCNATEGNPDTIVKVEPAPEVTFSNIRWGEINSTFAALAPPANRTLGFRAPSRARLY